MSTGEGRDRRRSRPSPRREPAAGRPSAGGKGTGRPVLSVYEYESESCRVVWLDDDGRHRYSKSCASFNDAIERTSRHPGWPWAIIRETSSREVLEQSR